MTQTFQEVIVMATRWTPEQLQAIEEDGTNIIVSAGAGSGKTAVLTERVLSKIKNGLKCF